VNSSLKPLIAAVQVGFSHLMAYRAEIIIQLFSAGVVVVLNGSIWGAAVMGKEELAGVPAAILKAHAVVAWSAVSFYATRVHEDIARRFRDGQIASDLLRPVSFQHFWYARDLGRAGASMLVQTIPLFTACWWFFGFPLPGHPGTWGLYLLSLLLGHATNFGLAFLVGVSAVRLQSVTGLAHVKTVLVSVFSGALIPLELFPASVSGLVECLPFRAMAQVPTRIFLEQPGAESGILVQLFWAGFLWVVGALAWARAEARLVVQGG
jgi:ABC-2 type transport system permease protein